MIKQTQFNDIAIKLNKSSVTFVILGHAVK